MKKIILTSVLLLIKMGVSNAQDVHIPDANFKAYLVGNSAINTNGDSEIQVSEAVAFTGGIYCYNKNIFDLSGIEAFTNITILYCYSNNLTNLDLSQNTQLIDFQCHSNQLISLDISKNILLQALWCKTNQLTNLDISKNTALIYLDCSSNQLTDLDISENTSLETLHCNFNSLTNLDLNNNNSLSYLSCYSNQLIDLDIFNTFLLKQLYCQDNQLTSLNLKNGNNTILTHIKTNNNPNLSCIQVDNIAYSNASWIGTNFAFDTQHTFNTECCTITIPDANFKAYLVGNAAININGDNEIQCNEASSFTGTINCSNLNISDLTGIEAFTSLTELNCSHNKLMVLNISDIFTLEVLFTNNNLLSSLDLSNNVNLINLACHTNQLSTLNLNNNTHLILLYCGVNQLTSLDLSNNIELGILYCDNNQISTLNLNNNDKLVGIVCENNQLVSLTISNGNNTLLTMVKAQNNPDLTCIQVDDAAYSTTNWVGGNFIFDPQQTFGEDCSNSVGTEKPEQNSLKSYPNPVNDVLHIEMSEVTTVQILDFTGKTIVQTEQLKTGNNIIDASKLTSGVYFIQAETGAAIKFVKE